MIDIACNIDRNYVKYCGVMLTSLLENNRDSQFHIHIIASELPESGCRALREIVEGKYGQTLSFYFPDESKLAECSVREHSYISLATYYRVFMGSILPATVGKVLYLDCDLVVNGNISELWQTDISSVSVAAVEDMFSNVDEYYGRLQYPRSFSYFNAGVMLVNLDRFRATQLEQRALDFLRNHPDRLKYYDQDLLNTLVHDDKMLLPHRWNVQDGFLRRRRSERMPAASIERLKKELEKPVIIHYTGSKKPWHYKSQHPWRNVYFRYLDMTQWKGGRPVMPFGYRVKLAADAVLRTFGLMKRKYLKFPRI